MEPGLQRFLDAQETAYPEALAEIRKGRKQGHWMWFIFPQITGLGHSTLAQYYAIGNRQEAADYLKHPVLGNRLIKLSSELLFLEESNPQQIFGYTDSMKLRSSMTLFYEVSGNFVFKKVLEKFFGGEPDARTLELLNK